MSPRRSGCGQLAALGLLWALALLAWPLGAMAQDCPASGVTATTPATARAADRFDQGRLWRLHPPGESAAAPSHVYGTMHVDDPRALAFSPALRSALEGSRVFMPELRVDSASEAQFRRAMQLPGSQALPDLVGEAAFEALANLMLDAYGIPPGYSRRLRPWAAYVTLSLPTRRMGEIVDLALIRLASQQRIPVHGLETVDHQIAALDAVPLPAQTLLLNTLVHRHAQAQADIDTAISCYLAGDLAALRRLQDAEFSRTPALQQAFAAFSAELLDRRNAQMLSSLLPQAQAGGAFVAAGAMHLLGEQGLLARLERLGWRIERVE